jgi:hypothetical protein
VVGGTGYELLRGGQRWLRLDRSACGRVHLGWPMSAYDTAAIVTFTVEAGRLCTVIRKANALAASLSGTDDVESIALDADSSTRHVVLAVPPEGPPWAQLVRDGSLLRILDLAGTLRAEIMATRSGLEIHAYDEIGQPLGGRVYLTP